MGGDSSIQVGRASGRRNPMVMGVGVVDKDEPSLDGHFLHARYKESGMCSIYKRMSSEGMVSMWSEATRGGLTHYFKRSASSSSIGDSAGLDSVGHLGTLLCVKQEVTAMPTTGICLRDKRFTNGQFESSFFYTMEGADTDTDGD